MGMLDRSCVGVGDRVCCAVSGGADSTALLRLVHEANRAKRDALGVGLSAVHVHHGLRGAEADGDEEFVRELCGRLGVPLRVARVEASGQRGSVEEVARRLRYEVFRGLIAEGWAGKVLTAHTLEDQAETVLMKLLRGAWTEGLGGIFPVIAVPGGQVVRPLLQVRREELRDYLRGLGQEWREDSTNADEAFTRNRLRGTVLPMLRAENPSLDRTLSNLAEIAREEECRWEKEMTRLLPQVLVPGKAVRGGGRSNSTAVGAQSVAVELERLRGFDPALRRRVVRAAAKSVGVRLGFDETARVLALAGFGEMDTVPSKPGAKLGLAGGLVAERSVRELRLSSSAKESIDLVPD